MTELLDVKHKISVENTLSVDDNVISEPIDTDGNQSKTSKSRDEKILPSIKLSKAQIICKPDLSYMQRLLDNYKATQVKVAESMKSLHDHQERVSKIINSLYEPMRYLIERTKLFSESINSALIPLKRMRQVMEACKDNQFVVWYSVIMDDGIDEPRVDYLNFLILEYFLENDSQRLNELFLNCKNALQKRSGYTLFEQSITSMINGQYHNAIIGFTSVLDGLLTHYSGSDLTSLGQRLDILHSKLLEQYDDSATTEEINELWLYYTLFPSIDSFGARAAFDDLEPSLLNRHWLMHGRSTRDYTCIDCIKVLSMIYGMILIGKFIINGK